MIPPALREEIDFLRDRLLIIKKDNLALEKSFTEVFAFAEALKELARLRKVLQAEQENKRCLEEQLEQWKRKAQEEELIWQQKLGVSY